MSVENLTKKEMQIFNLMLEGVTPKEIGYRLNIVYSTVDYHRQKIYSKLGVHTINELLTKYKSKQDDEIAENVISVGYTNVKDIIAIKPEQSSDFVYRKPMFLHSQKKKLVLISAGAVFFGICLLIIWYSIFGNSASKYFIYNHNMLLLSRHAEWRASINAFDEDGKIGSSAVLRVGKETILNQQKDVLTLTAYLNDKPNWKEANFVTGHLAIMRMLREGNGIRFKVLGDEEPGWKVRFWTNHDGNISYEYPIFTLLDQVVEIDIPFTEMIQPLFQTEIPFDANCITQLVIMRLAPCCCLFGFSTIKIFDLEIY
ncbi:MAG: LuxR C-terminal-related transcriptional regulator [Treponema sp.]|nr:LuxR C-terminal-related transcriptional regulator [Treponema sp.]